MTTHTTAPVLDTSALLCRDPYAVGVVALNGWPRHAVASRALADSYADEHVRTRPDGQREVRVDTYVPAVCGADTILAYTTGPFTRTNPHLNGHTVCAYCAWHVALTNDQTDEELDLLTPTETERPLLARELPDPLAARHLAEAVLTNHDDDTSDRQLTRILATITTHAPTVVWPQDCRAHQPQVVCPSRDRRLHTEPHPDTGQPVIIPADRTGPCQVFTDLMSRYTPTRPEEMQR